MDDATRRALKVFKLLSSEQMEEFFRVINPQDKPIDLYEEKARIEKRIDEIGIIMGPLGGKCPYCGK